MNSKIIALKIEDPLELVKTALQIYFEKKYNFNEDYPQSLRFAILRWSELISNEELKLVLLDYLKTSGGDCLVLEDENDLARLRKGVGTLIKNHPNIKSKIFEHQLKGRDGCGVADKTTGIFHPCEFGLHFETLEKILTPEYLEMNGIRTCKRLKYKNKELDNHIMKNIVFVGGQSKIDKFRYNLIHRKLYRIEKQNNWKRGEDFRC